MSALRCWQQLRSQAFITFTNTSGARPGRNDVLPPPDGPETRNVDLFLVLRSQLIWKPKGCSGRIILEGKCQIVVVRVGIPGFKGNV